MLFLKIVNYQFSLYMHLGTMSKIGHFSKNPINILFFQNKQLRNYNISVIIKIELNQIRKIAH